MIYKECSDFPGQYVVSLNQVEAETMINFGTVQCGDLDPTKSWWIKLNPERTAHRRILHYTGNDFDLEIGDKVLPIRAIFVKGDPRIRDVDI